MVIILPAVDVAVCSMIWIFKSTYVQSVPTTGCVALASITHITNTISSILWRKHYLISLIKEFFSDKLMADLGLSMDYETEFRLGLICQDI